MINSQPPTSFSAPPPPLPSSSSSSSSSSHSTMILLLVVVVILVATIFLCCLFCMVLRYFIKRSSSPVFQTSSRRLQSFSSRILRRQLQQLFRLHDSGLDQAVIDSLPVFCCKDIIVGNSNVQFDCAICLSVFSEQDKLRLLPVCGHAFHMDCIDTWLLSNSTCPLCRGTLFSSGLVIENSVLNFDDSRAMSSRYNGDGDKSDNGTPSVEDGVVEKQVFSVRLGKFRSSILNEELGETSSCYIDARRCYSMGTYQYVVGDSDLQVALPHACGGGIDAKLDVDGGHFKMSGNLEGKKIIGCYKGESFSLSKIWLWSKKNKFPDSLNTHTCMPSFSVTS